MMQITHKNEVKHSLKPSSHPYLSGAWTPNFTEYTASDMEVIGEIPTDIDGVYVRNTENPVQEPIGHYHPFDADGMIHAVSIRDGKAEYSNRFVRTKGFWPSKRPEKRCGLVSSTTIRCPSARG